MLAEREVGYLHTTASTCPVFVRVILDCHSTSKLLLFIQLSVISGEAMIKEPPSFVLCIFFSFCNYWARFTVIAFYALLDRTGKLGNSARDWFSYYLGKNKSSGNPRSCFIKVREGEMEKKLEVPAPIMKTRLQAIYSPTALFEFHWNGSPEYSPPVK